VRAHIAGTRILNGEVMAQKQVVSNVDLIRRYVFEHQPVSADQIAEEVKAQMVSIRDVETAKQKFVMPVLTGQPYFVEKDGLWSIELKLMPEYKALPAVFAEAKRLLYDREVRSKVARHLGIKVANVVLDLHQAEGLKQDGSYWGLASWRLMNNEAAEVLKQHTGGLTEKDLHRYICDRFGVKPDDAILNLKGERKRFVLDKKTWFLKTEYDKRKSETKEEKPKLHDLSGIKEIDSLLEGSFLDAHAAKAEEHQGGEAQSRARLRKALKKQAQDIIESREELKQEDLAAKLSEVLSAAGVEDYEVRSFQRVEAASKERGLSPKERDEIQAFLDQLLSQETVGVGAPLSSVVNAPLSARKVQDILRLKYINYSRDRAILPEEYRRLLVEILHPSLHETMIHPACYEGALAVELFNYLYDKLAGAAWSLVQDSNMLELVTVDGQRARLGDSDEPLLESARDRFIVTQVDLLHHFINFKYTGIEFDKVLARAARIITRLSGFEGVYIVSRDYLSELPEIFGLPGNEDNEIPHRFDCVAGNFTFVNDANLAANYLDQSLKLLAAGGRGVFFVLQELLVLLKEHALIGDILQEKYISHFIRLPLIEGRHRVVLLGIESPLASGQPKPQFKYAEVRDFKDANSLAPALQTGGAPTGLISMTDQLALGTLIN
jgi:hypothetical protein